MDFWRVILANKQEKRLLLYAEMKLPGQAWLEWSIYNEDGKTLLRQEATFRPRGIMGRLYWYGCICLMKLFLEEWQNELPIRLSLFVSKKCTIYCIRDPDIGRKCTIKIGIVRKMSITFKCGEYFSDMQGIALVMLNGFLIKLTAPNHKNI